MYRYDFPTHQPEQYSRIFHPLIQFLSVLLLGHKDSVTCAAFSHDSKLVASGDMSGLIKVWKVEAKEAIWSFEVGDLEVGKLKQLRP